MCSAVNMDNGQRDIFCNSEEEVSYGPIQLRPLLYQDDFARLSDCFSTATAGIYNMKQIMEGKLLDFNTDKSVFKVFGTIFF